MRKIWFVGLLALGLSACEKDDICSGSESETPNVVIGLFDRLDPEIRKSAAKIAATAEGSNQTLIFRSTSTIELPLQINTNETTWNLELFIPTGSNSDTIHKTDQLRFTYTPEALYVSKACGYKTIFHEFNAVKTTSVSNDTWIRSMNRLTNELTNTDNAHLQFYY